MTDSLCSNLQEWDQALPNSPDGHLRPDTRHVNERVFQKRSISQLILEDVIQDVTVKANNRASRTGSVDIDSNISFSMEKKDNNVVVKPNDVAIEPNDEEIERFVRDNIRDEKDDDIESNIIDINRLEMKPPPISTKPSKTSLISRFRRKRKTKHVKANKHIGDVDVDVDEGFTEWEKTTMVKLDNIIQNIYLKIFEAINDLSDHEYNGELPILTFKESDVNQVYIDNLDTIESKDLFYGAIYVIYKNDGNPYKFEVTKLDKLLNSIIKSIRQNLNKNIGIKHLTKNDTKAHKYLLVKDNMLVQPRQNVAPQQYVTPVQTQNQPVQYQIAYYQPTPQPSYWVREKYYRWVPYYYQ